MGRNDQKWHINVKYNGIYLIVSNRLSSLLLVKLTKLLFIFFYTKLLSTPILPVEMVIINLNILIILACSVYFSKLSYTVCCHIVVIGQVARSYILYYNT